MTLHELLEHIDMHDCSELQKEAVDEIDRRLKQDELLRKVFPDSFKFMDKLMDFKQ